MRHDTDILELHNALVFDPDEGLTPEHIERAKRIIAGLPFKIIFAVLDFRPRIKSWRDLFTSQKNYLYAFLKLIYTRKNFTAIAFMEHTCRGPTWTKCVFITGKPVK